MAFLGIDLGTSSVKVFLMGDDGQSLGGSGAHYPSRTPHPWWAQGDPQDWWRSTVMAMQGAHITESTTWDIAAIGLSGQMHGVVLADMKGAPVRPAMLWPDTRATAEVAHYAALPAPLRAALANPLVPGMMGPMLLWLRDHEPAVYAAARWALSPKDWVRWQLTGDFASDPSDASATLLYDISQNGWAEETIAALGLRRALLPDIRPSAAIAGTLRGSLAKALNLPDGIPVAVGGADTACAALGTGLLATGSTQLTLGTGIQLIQLTDQPMGDAALRTHLYRTVAGARWYRMAALQNGGLVLGWVIRMLGVNWNELYASADAVPPGADGVTFTPHLIPERTDAASAAGGAWSGLHMHHTRAHLLHAALEGVALSIRAALESLAERGADGPIRLAGGGSVHPAWRQMLADVVQRPLQVIEVADASARGAALLAGMAIGRWNGGQDLVALAPRVSDTTMPDPERAARYDALYQRFVEQRSGAL